CRSIWRKCVRPHHTAAKSTSAVHIANRDIRWIEQQSPYVAKRSCRIHFSLKAKPLSRYLNKPAIAVKTTPTSSDASYVRGCLITPDNHFTAVAMQLCICMDLGSLGDNCFLGIQDVGIGSLIIA